jgi:hypothetical protein
LFEHKSNFLINGNNNPCSEKLCIIFVDSCGSPKGTLLYDVIIFQCPKTVRLNHIEQNSDAKRQLITYHMIYIFLLKAMFNCTH